MLQTAAAQLNPKPQGPVIGSLIVASVFICLKSPQTCSVSQGDFACLCCETGSFSEALADLGLRLGGFGPDPPSAPGAGITSRYHLAKVGLLRLKLLGLR